ncbi:4Fe-4S single cluster domain-containing protein [Tenacibaculum dicentrarchi]|uniref:4Fe-4S single cluster domain-containing protein n=1 Tax=Tenacibaculum dicentrarchi TaxID=669041 RepID=UPI0035188F97
MNISHIEENSLIYGPGIRYVIWTQGCSIKCKGCWSKDTWSFKTKNIKSTIELLTNITKDKELEGVTILGGEAFDQYNELLDLIKEIRKTKLSIILYTGYKITELKREKKTEVLEFIDVLITGRYVEEKKNIQSGGLVGSYNQEIIFYSKKYSKNDLVELNESEISIDENGKISIYGYETEDLKKYL